MRLRRCSTDCSSMRLIVLCPHLLIDSSVSQVCNSTIELYTESLIKYITSAFDTFFLTLQFLSEKSSSHINKWVLCYNADFLFIFLSAHLFSCMPVFLFYLVYLFVNYLDSKSIKLSGHIFEGFF